MSLIVSNSLVLQPLPDAILEVLAPDRAELDTCFVQACVQVKHSHQARPLARPVGDSQNRAAMALESRKNIMAVLPDRLHHDDRRVRVQSHEDIHAHSLVIDKTVAKFCVEWIGTANLDSLSGKCFRHLALNLSLGGPADLVGGLAKITA